jgi:hypothetical protein
MQPLQATVLYDAARMQFRRLAFVPAIVLVALVAAGRASLTLLQGGVALGAVGLVLLRRGPSRERVQLLEGLASLGLALVVVFFAHLGDPVPFALAPFLAVLFVGTTPLWIAADGGPAAAPAASGWVGRLRPSRALALLLVYYGTLLAHALVSLPTPAAAYGWLVAAGTAIAVVPIVLLSLPPGWPGRLGVGAAFVVLEVALVWQAASFEVAVEQARALPWDEVRLRLGEPGGWQVLAAGLSSLRFALSTVAMVAGYVACERALRRRSPATSLLGAAKLVGAATVCGLLLLRQPYVADRALASAYRQPTAAPWSWVHARPPVSRPFDRTAAAAIRRRAEPPVWEPGPAVPLDTLASRYEGRSIIVVLLESQALRLVPGLGEGAFGYAAAQPELARLARSGLLFTNYFADSFPTHSALWSVLTGLSTPPENPPGVFRAPEAATLGRLPDFRALGYRADWLCPASPRFDNWDRILTAAGARWWIENAEVAGLDRRHWTSWGMPDDQLYEIAEARYLATPRRGSGYLMGLLTVSNHRPYRLPQSREDLLPADHVGGTRYGDRAVGRFVDRLMRLPPHERPIVFLTADTAQLEGLHAHEPLGIRSLESLRIPGLLLLPDGAYAGRRYEGVFAHEDLLDLLYLLVSPSRDGSGRRFIDRHRAVHVVLGGTIAVSATQMCVSPPLRCFDVEGRWTLRPTEPAAAGRLLDAMRQFAEDDAALWPAAGVR